MRKFFKEFKEFISRGNIVDLAVGVIIGSAFTAIVTALTNKIFMPIINWIVFAATGGKSVNLITVLNGKDYLIDDGGTMVVNPECIFIDWGAFIIAIINFLLVALVLFLIIKALMKAKSSAKASQEKKITKAEIAELEEKGVNVKNRKELKKSVEELRAEKKAKAEEEAAAAAAEAKANSTESLLKEIRDLLKENNAPKAKSKKTE